MAKLPWKAADDDCRERIPMRASAVMNQKGGVGKTTTSVNLSAALAARGHRVCVLDLDPQGHTSYHFGVEAVGSIPTVYDIFSGEKKLADVRNMVGQNLWIVPSNIDLAGVEIELARTKGREFILRDAVNEMLEAEEFDYLIIDCPPSLGILTVNALVAVSEVFIPLQPHFFALQGLSKLFETTALVTRRLNRDLQVTGIIMCLYETGTRLAADVTDDLQTFLARSESESPWSTAKIFTTRIRRNIKLAEAPSFGQSIFEYAPSSAGAKDYASLATEISRMQLSVATTPSPKSVPDPVRKAA
jgi:chromosome partitioning protein